MSWPAIDRAKLVKQIKFMDAALPSRTISEEQGRDRVTVYVRILGEYSEPAIRHLVQTACTTLDWFPTPRQCLEILGRYSDPPTPGAQALIACQSFAQLQFEEFRLKLKAGECEQEMLDAAPPQWKRIAVEQGFLRCDRAGVFTFEPRYAPRVDVK